ncbi:hypothetical protein [Acidovorax sp. Root219]|uniref:hypothetical protein n=1 Tax=Acidovorax sp. Root219 TaxID=1736493 RepID=UPI00070DE098|nr:hypothetical protein [Acidovorax sp. Root219]KRC36266.1 hypothetical protein ASE28_01670 [Acidovorax sp. Root219]
MNGVRPNLTTAVAIVALLGAFFFAQADDTQARQAHYQREKRELAEAQHSRDWALQQFQKNACRPGETAMWVEDQVAECLRDITTTAARP